MKTGMNRFILRRMCCFLSWASAVQGDWLSPFLRTRLALESRVGRSLAVSFASATDGIAGVPSAAVTMVTLGNASVPHSNTRRIGGRDGYEEPAAGQEWTTGSISGSGPVEPALDHVEWLGVNLGTQVASPGRSSQKLTAASITLLTSPPGRGGRAVDGRSPPQLAASPPRRR